MPARAGSKQNSKVKPTKTIATANTRHIFVSWDESESILIQVASPRYKHLLPARFFNP